MANKISFDFIKNNRRDIVFFIVGIILSASLIYVFIDGTSFLVSNIETSLEVGASSYSPTKFNIDGLKSLGIYQGQATSAVTSTNVSTSPALNGSSSVSTSTPDNSGVTSSTVPLITP